jgi:Cu(I)/Ag(I) efflux system membrane protein CusA/SilA
VGDLETVRSVMDSLRVARTDGNLKFPEGNFELQAVGSFQNQIEANRRLMWIVPLVLLINLLLIYLDFRNLSIALVVFSGIPVAFAGGMIALAVVGVEVNTAVWVGFIALFGIAVDDGVVMATYIKQSLERTQIEDVNQLREAIMLSAGRGSDVARAMALPVFGGMLVEPFTTFIVPTIYCAYMELKLRLGARDELLSASQAERPSGR